MTKRKAVAFIFILAIVILISAFGITSARYSSTVEVNQTIEYAKIIGKLSLYNPQNVESFPEGETCYDASEGCFRICASKPGCDNIKFSNPIPLRKTRSSIQTELLPIVSCV